MRDIGLSDQDLKDVADATPVIADAVATLYRSYQEAVEASSMLAERLADRDDDTTSQAIGLPIEEVRDFINAHTNHFPELDEAAEDLYASAKLSADEPYVALRDYLRDTHGVSTRVVPADFMPGELRRYDRHRQTMFLSDCSTNPGDPFSLPTRSGFLSRQRHLSRLLSNPG